MMRTVVASLAAMIAGLVLLGGASVMMTPCQTEDSVMCVWDAHVQGNGQGTSFISLTDDIIIPIGGSR